MTIDARLASRPRRAAAAFSPFIAGAHPSLFNLGSFAELERPVNLSDPFKNSDALSHLNVAVCSSGLGHRFITMAFVVLDPHAHTLGVVNAGHLPPLVRRASGQLEQVGTPKTSGLALGMFEEAK